MKKLKIAIIGCGNIVKCAHSKAILDNEHMELAAVCDINKEKAREIAAEHGIDKIYTDYRELLDKEDVDAVDICTPNSLHSIIAVYALNKGKHVFCEKPDAVRTEEVLKMKKAGEDSGKILMVMRNNRYRNETVFLKEYIKGGNMGEIYAARCGWVRRRGIPGKGGWFTTKELSGGGPLIDLGVHMIDLAIWLMGSPTPISVVGSTYCKFSNTATEADSVNAQFGEAKEDGVFDVEDLAMGFIKFDNGACLSIEFSWASNIEAEKNFVQLMGTKAGADLSSNSELKIFGESNGVTATILPNINEENGTSGHAKNINHFADCILNGSKPDFIPQQGVDMIKILTAVYQSAETGREVRL